MNLKTYLRREGIKHFEFAEQIGVSNVTISRWISGTNMPRPEQLKEIYHATQGRVTANDFLDMHT